MSWYYTYYIGKKKDGKIYPLGPYDAEGKLHAALERSRSFASDLYHDFVKVKEEMISGELRKEFELKDWNGNMTVDVYWLPLTDLKSDDFIKRGYFLTEDVQQYIEDKENFEGFYDRLSPEVYAAKVLAEAKMGPPKPLKDDCGEEYLPHSAADYMYFAYPDYESREYETHLLRVAAYTYENVAEEDLVVLMTQG